MGLSACVNLKVYTRSPFSLNMRYVAAYLLSSLGGNTNVEAKDIKKILESVGIEADDTRMEKVISELNGKNVDEVIAQGYGKLARRWRCGSCQLCFSRWSCCRRPRCSS